VVCCAGPRQQYGLGQVLKAKAAAAAAVWVGCARACTVLDPFVGLSRGIMGSHQPGDRALLLLLLLAEQLKSRQ